MEYDLQHISQYLDFAIAGSRGQVLEEVKRRIQPLEVKLDLLIAEQNKVHKPPQLPLSYVVGMAIVMSVTLSFLLERVIK